MTNALFAQNAMPDWLVRNLSSEMAINYAQTVSESGYPVVMWLSQYRLNRNSRLFMQ